MGLPVMGIGEKGNVNSACRNLLCRFRYFSIWAEDLKSISRRSALRTERVARRDLARGRSLSDAVRHQR